MTAISTHVLDTARGAPAAGIRVVLDDGAAEGVTDADGRVSLGDVGPGTHRLTFAVDTPFFPEVVVTFVAAGEAKLHIPLLLSPYGYSTYRGS